MVASCIESGSGVGDGAERRKRRRKINMRGYGLWLMALSCWASGAVAAPAASAVTASAASAVPASAVKAARSPEEDYQLGMKARWTNDNLPDAVMLFTRAADRGHAAAQAELAELLEVGSAWGLARDMWRKSADQGYAPAQYGLGVLFTADRGSAIKRDHVEARKWITLAGEQGYAPAIRLLATAYMGRKEVLALDADARSGPDALRWIKRAADINAEPAIKALADAYRSGQYGLAVDPAQAGALDAKLKELHGGVKEEKKKKQRVLK